MSYVLTKLPGKPRPLRKVQKVVKGVGVSNPVPGGESTGENDFL